MRRKKYIIVTFLCLVTYLIYLKIMRIYPFGEYSILKCDLYQQYINFFCYLKQILLEGKSIVICWNLGLANYFYTTLSYYLFSPLNLLVIFFNHSNMDIFIEIITFIKLALMANFMILFLEKSYNYKDKETIFFGLIYAFSSYTICYSFHIMWLDCLYMLPIVLLFVDKYLNTGKILPYALSLSFSILTNYYIGYIVAFFSGIYYLVRYYMTKEKETFLKSLLNFLVGVIFAFGIGTIVILPSIMQLSGKISVNIEFLKLDIEKLRLFINVLFNNYIYMFTQKSCFMFSSTLTLLLIPMYYLNKEISKKEKISFTSMLIFLLLPIISPFLNRVWHAFTIPNCFNYRYSFTLIFILILMSAREFQNKEYIKRSHFIFSAFIFLLLTSIEIVFMNKGYLQSDNYTVSINSIIISCIVFALMEILFYIIVFYSDISKSLNVPNKKRIKAKAKKCLYILFLAVIILDLMIGAKNGQNNNDKYFKRETITQYDSFMNYFLAKLKLPETERIVFAPDQYGSNMSLKYGYSNIGFFTSARNRDTLTAMYRLGYNVQMDEQLWITSYSGTFLNYSIAGVRYFISKEPVDIYGFEFEEKYNNLYIYKNRNAFDIGYYLSKNIEKSYNPFKMQNELLNSMRKENEIKYFEDLEKSSVLTCKKNTEYDEKSKQYKIDYYVKAKDDCTIYLQSDNDLQLYINNEPQFENYSNIWSTETGIKQIKNLKEGEELDFKITTKHNLEQLYVYVSDNEKIQNTLNSEKYNIFRDIKINKNGLCGNVIFKDDGYLVFSIAYDNCWDIYVDGEKKERVAIAGCFLGVKLERGEHKIKICASLF